MTLLIQMLNAVSIYLLAFIVGISINRIIKLAICKSFADFKGLENAALSILIGFIYLTTLYVILGLCGRLEKVNLIIGAFSISIIGLFCGSIKSFWVALVGPFKFFMPTRYFTLLSIVLAPGFLFGALTASLPTSNWDAISYTLTLPKIHIQEMGLRYVQEYGIFSAFPAYGEAILGIPLIIFGDEISVQFVMLLFYPIFLFYLVKIFEEVSSSKALLFLAITAIGFMPIVIVNLGLAKVEIFQGAYLFSSLLLLIHAFKLKSNDIKLLSFILLAFSCGIKYTSALFLPLYLCAYLIFEIKQRSTSKIYALDLLKFSLAGMIINLPWLISNYIEHCNPLFPNLVGVFGSCRYPIPLMNHIHSMIAESTIYANNLSWASNPSPLSYYKLFASATGVYLAPVVWFGCLISIVRYSPSKFNWSSFLVLPILAVFLYQMIFSLWEFRYAIPLLSMLIVFIFGDLGRHRFSMLAVLIVSIFICFQAYSSTREYFNLASGIIRYATSEQERRNFKLNKIHLYWVADYLNSQTPKNAVIAFNWGVQPFYHLDRKFFFIHEWNPDGQLQVIDSFDHFVSTLKMKQVSYLAWRVPDESRYPANGLTRAYYAKMNQYLHEMISRNLISPVYAKEDVVIYKTEF